MIASFVRMRKLPVNADTLTGRTTNLIERSAMPIHSSKSFRTIERKLYPNIDQEKTLESYRIECCRIYNRALEQRIKAYKRRKETPSLYDQQKWLTDMRGRIESLRLVPVWFARDALSRVDRGFKAFFRRAKSGVKKKGFPRFRACHRYRSMEFAEPRNFFRDGKVFIPGIGEVTSRGRDAAGKQKTLRIIKRADAWYVQVLIEVYDLPPVNPQSSVGIDMGLITFATLSTGDKIENPRWYRKAQDKLRRAQKSLSRKKKGSKNRAKAREKLARVHERIGAQRKDFAHQESRKLVNRFDLIGFENLNIAGLARTRMAKSVLDAAWGFFLFCIAYKAANAGRHAVAVDACGTSQECPRCGEIKKKALSERRHECTCGCNLDRDHAAAIVIEARALAIAGASNLRRDGPLMLGTRSASSPLDETGSPNIASCTR